MSLLPVAMFGGMALGYLSGGRLRRLGAFPVRAPLLVGGALAVQLGLGRFPAGARFSLVVTSNGLVGAWLAVNATGRPGRARVAIGLLALGWLMNLAVILPNGGMPVSTAAMAEAGFETGATVTDGHLYKHVPAGPRTSLSWLGDRIPVRPAKSVVSAGDVVMLIGLAWTVMSAMAGTGAPPPRRLTLVTAR